MECVCFCVFVCVWYFVTLNATLLRQAIKRRSGSGFERRGRAEGVGSRPLGGIFAGVVGVVGADAGV